MKEAPSFIHSGVDLWVGVSTNTRLAAAMAMLGGVGTLPGPVG